MPLGQNAATQPNASQNYKVYKLRGKVVSTDAAKGEVTLNHEAIPGFMDAMTMPYKLKDASILSELHPGDVITADVLVSQDPDADVLLDHIVVVAQGKPDYKPAVCYHVPAPGDAVPDFKLRNQDGRPIHLGQFKGKALLVTFIYTRCPLPDFCPRVTRNFAAVDKQMAANPALYAQDASAVRQLRSGARHAGAAAGLWGHLYRQRCEECFCALGFCGAGASRCCWRWRSSSIVGMTQRGRWHDYAHALDHADRAATARWCGFIRATSGRRSRWWRM